ncbi:MAG: allophanate hydrolase [Oleiphilus sp.]|nr:MAG: allophanate hydrolase [Oleiphilus sp.]
MSVEQLMTVSALTSAYRSGTQTPESVMHTIRQRAEQYNNYNIWIHLLSEAELMPYLEALADKSPETCPLWGIPFAIKDNIDLAGIPTTAACEAFAYTPKTSATVVQKLIAAGAIPVGKTNMDQFATGLNGTRSPWGACKNAFDPEHISGGSSSGSAVALALGMASFSLGSDTAGSGRVPACFNNLVGLKPSRGILSATGMVPACKSLDCMSIFTLTCEDANLVLASAEGLDQTDAYSIANPFSNQSRHFGSHGDKLRVGHLPETALKFFGDQSYAQAYRDTLDSLDAFEVEWVEIDYAPFEEAARLLYEGPWVAERYLATQPLMDEQPEAMFPVVKDIIQQGAKPKAAALFSAGYRLEALKKICQAQLESLDCLLSPTAPSCFTIAQLLEQPIERNSQLGYYTNYMNLLDLAAVAVPTQITPHGLPFGVTLVGPKFSDRYLLSIATRLQNYLRLPVGASELVPEVTDQTPVTRQEEIDVLVCGAHLDGLPLNWQLRERGAKLKRTTRTAPCYRMYALAGGPPFRPGLVLDETQGAAIDVEIWSMPAGQFGSFVAGIPAPLGIGKVRVEDGSQVCGFICEPYGLDGAEEITHLGGWRAYLAR